MRPDNISAKQQGNRPLSADASKSSTVPVSRLLLFATEATTTRHKATLASARNIWMRRDFEPELGSAGESGRVP